MAYQSVHSGPAIDAAVTQLADIQIVRDESNANLATVQNLAAQVATDAGTASTAAASATQTLNDATAAIAAADHARQEQIDAEIAIVADQRFAAEQAATEAVAAADAAVVTVTQDMAASVPTPNKLPLADAQGKIASDWLGADIARGDALSAADGAGLVGFQQSGAGAVARTMQDKAREVVSVRDFGAVGDGVTDDTAAIQACLNSTASTGECVFLSAGTYLISSQLTVYANTRLSGENAAASIIKVANGSNANGIVTASGASNVEIVGLGVDGNRANQTTTTISGVTIGANNTNFSVKDCRIVNVMYRGIAVGTNCSNGHICGNYIDGTEHHSGIDISAGASGTRGIIVSNNRVLNTQKGNIAATGVVERCVISDNICDTTNAGSGLGTELGDNITAYNASNLYLTVTGNLCMNSGNHGIHVGGNHVVVGGNTVSNAVASGILLAKSPNGAATASINGVVSDNSISHSGINGIDVQNYKPFSVAGNSVTSNTSYGIAVQASSGGSVSGNACRLNGNAGILLNDGVVSVSISGNTCIDNTEAGVLVGVNGGACSDCVVSGNILRSNTTYGYQEGNSAARIIVGSNNLRNNTSGEMSLLSTSLSRAVENVCNGGQFKSVALTAGGVVDIGFQSNYAVISGDAAGLTVTDFSPKWPSRMVVLRWTGANAVTVSDASPLFLAGGFTSAYNKTLTLMCDGTAWHEVARSTN